MRQAALAATMGSAPMHALIDRLPAVRGGYRADVPLAKYTWLRVGGAAEVLFEPADRDDLAHFIAGKPTDVPVTVIGVASNLLVRDGGIPGVTIRLGRAFSAIDFGDGELRVEAGALDIEVARAAQRAGRGGLAFLSGIPGTIGGALRMNAGAYGSEIADVLVEAEAIDDRGERHHLTAAQMGFGYRHVGVSRAWIFTAATLAAPAADPAAIKARMDEIQVAREASQPIRARTGGSTFANPPGDTAWRLIDQAGCRGLRRGDAQVSEKHCNFLINTGAATAADMEALGEEVRAKVRAACGVELTWEVQRVGVPLGGPDG